MVDTTSTSAPESTSAHSRLARRWLRWAAIAMALLLALILAAALLISFMDWNKLRPWINEKSAVPQAANSPSMAICSCSGPGHSLSIRDGVTGCPA